MPTRRHPRPLPLVKSKKRTHHKILILAWNLRDWEGEGDSDREVEGDWEQESWEGETNRERETVGLDIYFIYGKLFYIVVVLVTI